MHEQYKKKNFPFASISEPRTEETQELHFKPPLSSKAQVPRKLQGTAQSIVIRPLPMLARQRQTLNGSGRFIKGSHPQRASFLDGPLLAGSYPWICGVVGGLVVDWSWTPGDATPTETHLELRDTRSTPGREICWRGPAATTLSSR